jgi:hypothetical protein
MATPSEILRKTKSTEKKVDKEDDNDKDDKSPKRNALIDFIAKHKSNK